MLFITDSDLLLCLYVCIQVEYFKFPVSNTLQREPRPQPYLWDEEGGVAQVCGCWIVYV